MKVLPEYAGFGWRGPRRRRFVGVGFSDDTLYGSSYPTIRHRPDIGPGPAMACLITPSLVKNSCVSLPASSTATTWFPVTIHLRIKTVVVSDALIWCIQIMLGEYTAARHHNSALVWRRSYHGNPGTIFSVWHRTMLCRLISPRWNIRPPCTGNGTWLCR